MASNFARQARIARQQARKTQEADLPGIVTAEEAMAAGLDRTTAEQLEAATRALMASPAAHMDGPLPKRYQRQFGAPPDGMTVQQLVNALTGEEPTP